HLWTIPRQVFADRPLVISDGSAFEKDLEESHGPGSKEAGWPSPRSQLLRLQSLDIVHEIRDSLLNWTLMSLTKTREKWSPDRHILVTMRWVCGLSTDDRRNVGRGILSVTLLCQLGQISRRSFHC